MYEQVVTLPRKVFNADEMAAYEEQTVTQLQSRIITETSWLMLTVLTAPMGISIYFMMIKPN
jgi:hypothetical protein